MKKNSFMFLTLLSLFMTTTVFANPEVDPGDYVDSRTKLILTNPSGGLEGFGAAALLPYSMMWTITDNANGTFNFDYDLSLLSGITTFEFFVQSTSGITASDLSDVTVNSILLNPNTSVVDTTIFGVSGILFSNDFIIPTSITDVSFNVAAYPEWGSFLNGELVVGFITNEDYGMVPVGPSFTNFVPVVGVQTPEPSTYLLISSLLSMVAFACYRKRATVKVES